MLSEQEAIAYERDLVGRWSDRFGDLEVTTTGELSEEWQEAAVRARAQSRAEALEAHPADDPEARTLYERCLIGSSGPPMLPPVYNQNLQIVQTRDHTITRA